MKYAHQGNPDLTWETLSDVSRFALLRCIDRVREGQPGLVAETFDNGDVYAYSIGDKINFGLNGSDGCNIFRDQCSLSQSGDERKHPMPKKLKLKDWQDEVRRGNPEMFDPKPMTLAEPKKSPLIKQTAEEMTHEEKVGIVKRAFGWFK
jgi:hypothetical protein